MKMLKALVRRYVPVRWREFISVLRSRGPLAVGEGSRVHRTAQIVGRSNVRIGKNSCISERVWLNVNNRIGNGIAISIGDNTFIGRDNFISSGRAVHVGDYCLTAIGCRFISSTHSADTPWLPIASTGTTLDDTITIGSNCFFGAGATVLGNLEIGHGSVIGANALVLTDIPAFSLAIGNPAKVLKRYSFKRKSWIRVQDLQDGDLDHNPDAAKYLNQLREVASRIDIPWIASGADQGSF